MVALGTRAGLSRWYIKNIKGVGRVLLHVSTFQNVFRANEVDMLLFIAALARIFSVCIIKCLPWPYFL
ncbi:MAG: hypothetical protein ACK53Y_12050, partial [bacterium]